MSEAAATTPENKTWHELLPQLECSIVSSRFGKAARLSLKILSTWSSELPEEVSVTLRRIHVKSLIRCGSFKDALEYAKGYRLKCNRDESDISLEYSLVSEEAYTLYRTKRFESCRDLIRRILKKRLLSNDSERVILHVLAQSLYRLNECISGSELYGKLLDEENTEKEELLTNYLASVIMHHTELAPYHDILLSGCAAEVLSKAANSEKSNFNYDLAYNAGTYLALTSTSSVQLRQACDILENAISACELSFDDEDENERESELAPLRANFVYALLQSNSPEVDKHFIDGELKNNANVVSPAMQNALVAHASNYAVWRSNLDSVFDSLKRLPDVSTELNPLQTRLLLWNKAVLLTRMGREKEARSTILEFHKFLKPYSKIEKSSCYAAMKVQLHVLEKHVNNSKPSFQDLNLDKYQNIHPNTEAYVALIKVHGTSGTEKLHSIQNFPPVLKTKPAVVATLSAMHRDLNLPEDPPSFSAVTARDTMAHAAFQFRLGNYEKAIDLYEEIWNLEDLILNERMLCTAMMVRAYSWVDPQKAREILEHLPAKENVELDAEALEKMELPRQKLSKASARVRIPKQRKKKSSEAVLRSRARKREKYLKMLEENGKYDPKKISKPDAERWIPKKMRSYSKKRRGRKQQFFGAQGGGANSKDTAKLDVKERKKEQMEGGITGKPSTAHMDVSSSVGNLRRGGRRR